MRPLSPPDATSPTTALARDFARRHCHRSTRNDERELCQDFYWADCDV